jgi:nucleoside-diphosphate-sugar epimerase
MKKKILVIGGTRLFGKVLVQDLLDAGHAVTLATRGHTPDDFGDRVSRISVDRRDARAMQACFARVSGFDLVYDQVCYSPLDAHIAAATFAGKVGRYIMASTIEVYRPAYGHITRPLREDDLDLQQERIERDFPWHAPELAEYAYSAGKRQAEAYFAQDGRLPFVSVRIAHVLAGPEDFTGRTANYVERAVQGETLRYAQSEGRTSFLNSAEISRFLSWAGQADFLGSVNAACAGQLSARALQQACQQLAGRAVQLDYQALSGEFPPTLLSPFDYAHDYLLDTSRAAALGYRFTHTRDWLPQVIAAHAPEGARDV